MRDLFIQKLLKKMSENASTILLTADLGFGAFDCFEKFFKQPPNFLHA